MLPQFKGKENEAQKGLKVVPKAMLKSTRAKFQSLITKNCALSTAPCGQWEKLRKQGSGSARDRFV